MDVYREEIDNKKMIRSADEKCGFSRFYIESKKDVDIKKRPEDANGEKQKIGFCPGPAENHQYGQCEKTDQCQ